MQRTFKFEIQKEIEFEFPADISKGGRIRRENEIIKAIWIQTNLISCPLIIASDLHHRTQNVFMRIRKLDDLSKYVVITAGDMAGASLKGRGIRGSGGNPTNAYRFISNNAKALYFVQGNHDLPAPNNNQLRLKNQNGTRCSLSEQIIQLNGLGRVGGVDGIISNRSHPYKLPAPEYFKKVENVLKKNVDVLVTHETPAIPDPRDSGRLFIGKKELFNLVCWYRPQIHIYGHCYHPVPIIEHAGTVFINGDDRVLLFSTLDSDEPNGNKKR